MNTAKEILRKHTEAFCKDNPDYEADLDSPAAESIYAAITEHTDLATKDLQEENRQLSEWKRQQLEVWGPVHDAALKYPDIRLGESTSQFVLKRLQDYQQLKERAEAMGTSLKESIECMKWMWDNMRIEQGKEYLQSDAFNIPANAIDQAEQALAAYQTNK